MGKEAARKIPEERAEKYISGGGRSPLRTRLSRKFPLTGKNTGKMLALWISQAIKISISLVFRGISLEWSQFVTGHEQGRSRERNRD
jgi:hypothetical protein